MGEGNFENPIQPKTSPNISTIETPENTLLSKPTINELPKDTVMGNIITFNNTIDSNPDDFDAIYMYEIAKQYNLDPKADYEKIEQMSKDPMITEPLKKKLEQDSSKSYAVTEIRSAGSKLTETKKDYNADFFKKFDYLPNNGIVEVRDEELKDVNKIYIGTGINTPAFANMAKSGVYGDEDLNPTYFSTDYKVAMSHMHDEAGDVKPALIEISLPKLQQYRKILRDPESLYIGSESGKTFITFHGIPTEAIERILVLRKQ